MEVNKLRTTLITKVTIISDDENLWTVPIKDSLLNMEIGEVMVWPLSKFRSVSSTASQLNTCIGRKYRVSKMKDEKTVKIFRFS